MWAERDFAGNLYYMLNFNTYKEGMVTLFMVRAEFGVCICVKWVIMVVD